MSTENCVGGDFEKSLDDFCGELRAELKTLGVRTLSLKNLSGFTKSVEAYPGQFGEMIANVMLTYRHIEDARMRVGKILQAAGDGVSSLDK